MTPLRSVLYVPGSNERALRKAAELPADAVIFDLEDAVADSVKAEARQRVCELLGNTDFGPRQRIVRINDPDGADGEEDLLQVLRAGPDAILLPKIESAEELEAHLERIDELGEPGRDRDLKVWAMIETPLAVLDIARIAELATFDPPRLDCLVVGTNDLVKETGVQPGRDRALLLPWLMQVVLAARAYDLRVLDGVYNDYADEAGFDAACAQGRAMGMDGKTLIHPRQIEPANQHFAPSGDEIDEARLVVEAFERPENAATNIVSIEGRMVERLHYHQAQRLLAMAKAIGKS